MRQFGGGARKLRTGHHAVGQADGDEVRVVLIFDLWNPLLDDEDRRVVQTLTAAAREFRL